MSNLELVGSIFALAASIGGVFAFFSYGRAKNDNAAKDNAISTLGELLDAKEKLIVELRSRAAAAEETARVLQDRVTQAPAIEKLIAETGRQHKEVITSLTHLTEKLGDLAQAITGKANLTEPRK